MGIPQSDWKFESDQIMAWFVLIAIFFSKKTIFNGTNY
jgi:hypothetical protein